jgi:hypothetical protein
MPMDKPAIIERNVTIGLLIVSGVVCVPLALLATIIFAHAPATANNPLVIFYPWSLIIVAWGGVWLLWRTGRWVPAWFVLIVLIVIYAYFWTTFELP